MKRLFAIGGLGILALVLATAARSAFDSNQAAKLRRAQSIVTTSAPAGSTMWRSSIKVALDEAAETGKPIFIDFYADWCGPCKLLDKAYLQPAMIKEMDKWIPVRVDVEQNKLVAQTYQADSLPTLVFLSAKGDEIGRQQGFSVPSGVTEKELLGYVTADVIDTMRENEKKNSGKGVAKT
jgi:thiol:disulfide interchange protein